RGDGGGGGLAGGARPGPRRARPVPGVDCAGSRPKREERRGQGAARVPPRRKRPARALPQEGRDHAPRPYTEAALLGAMETAGKLVTDEALKEGLKEKGLGTPATRAAIIEELPSRERPGSSL